MDGKGDVGGEIGSGCSRCEGMIVSHCCSGSSGGDGGCT